MLGYDPATLTQDQYTKVKDLFQQFVDQTNGVSASYGDLTTKLVAGDVIACYEGWAAVNSFAAGVGRRHDQDDHGRRREAPRSATPGRSRRRRTTSTPSLAWINEVISPEINAKAAEYLVGGVTVSGSVDLLDESTKSLYPYDHLDSLLEHAPFFDNPPVESDEYVTIERGDQGLGRHHGRSA